MHTATTASAVKRGEYVRLKIDGPVWVRGEYCRVMGRYSLTSADDMNREILVTSSRVLYVGFTY